MIAQAIISSSFESSLGLAQLAQLAAAVDSALQSTQRDSIASQAHGLGTVDWFATDIVPHNRALCCAPTLAVARAHGLVQGVAAGQGAEASSLGEAWECSEAVMSSERVVVEGGTNSELVFDFAITRLANAPAPTLGKYPPLRTASNNARFVSLTARESYGAKYVSE